MRGISLDEFLDCQFLLRFGLFSYVIVHVRWRVRTDQDSSNDLGATLVRYNTKSEEPNCTVYCIEIFFRWYRIARK